MDQARCDRCWEILGGTRIEFEVGVKRPRSATSYEHRIGKYTKRGRFRVLDRRSLFLCHPCQRRLLFRAIVSGDDLLSRMSFRSMLLASITLSAVLGAIGLGESAHRFEWAVVLAFAGTLLLYRHFKRDPQALAQLALSLRRAELAKTFGVAAHKLRVRVSLPAPVP